MTYASQNDLIERFGEPMLVDLTDRADPPVGEIDAEVVARALADADAVINGYLSGRYKLPLAQTPDLLRDLAIAIAGYKLHRATASDKVRQDYDDAISTLKQIANGIVRLNVEGVEPTAAGTAGARVTDRERPLTAATLKGYI